MDVHTTQAPPTAFRVGELRRDGLSRRRIDDPGWERPFAGLRAVADRVDHDEHPRDLARRRLRRAARHFAAHMHTGEFFSHQTAAVLWGLPGLAPDDLDVSVLAPARAPRGRGVRGHQLSPKQVGTTVTPDGGLRITTPASTWAQLGGLVRHPYDLTAIADAIIRIPRMPGPWGVPPGDALATRADLAVELERGRRIGINALRGALARCRQGASSSPETWTRLTIVDAGLPEPELDHDVYDETGRFVGCVDLAYPERWIAIEYEGDHHRTDPAQWNRDIAKYDRLAELGWRVIRVTRAMLFTAPGELTARVRSALRSRPLRPL
ncbi:endonuclease domain-containing protein [Microbacterium sp.]|uniref:endonuclease domain-containing protein n=1 Tax=Microbacterium sp. TaxID=51671 RepID=UPI0039E5C3F7